jgi:Flp pilus assembly protein TadD
MHIRPVLAPLLFAATVLTSACAGDGFRHRPPPGEGPATAQDDRGMYLQLIRQMQQQGAYYASLAHIEAFRQRYGDSPGLRLLQADALRETHQADAAARLYQGLLQGPQAAAAWHGLGLIAAGQGQDARAEQALAKAVQLAPLDTAYLGDLGFARLRGGQVEAAHDPLARAAELAPANAKALANLSLWTMLGGDTAKAEAIMQQAKLPPATREEVRRLAMDLRAEADARRAAAPAAVAGGATAAARRQNPSPPAAGVPSGMLDRFGAAGAPTSPEASP